MRLLLGLLLCGAAFTSQAACVGTGNFRTCTDNAGNSYNIQRFGNSTTMSGTNPRTGSEWSQQSHTFGNTTNTYGRDATGRTWNSTTITTPGTTQQFGRDSRGQPFSKICTAAGCF
jgi:hypothetical protein